jgi:hypothetical protein
LEPAAENYFADIHGITHHAFPVSNGVHGPILPHFLKNVFKVIVILRDSSALGLRMTGYNFRGQAFIA